MTRLPNEKNKFVLMKPLTDWSICMDFQKFNPWTEKDYLPITFMDQMLNNFAGKLVLVY